MTDREAEEGYQERRYIDLQPSAIVWRIPVLLFHGGLISALDNTHGSAKPSGTPAMHQDPVCLGIGKADIPHPFYPHPCS